MKQSGNAADTINHPATSNNGNFPNAGASGSNGN